MSNLNKPKRAGDSRGRTPDGKPNPVDVHVGRRIRLRRLSLNLTQGEIADMLGLTFQQIQKYEQGKNRIAASRLWDIANIFNVSITFFYQDMDEKTSDQSPRMLQISANGISAEKTYSFLKDDPMMRDETLQLVTAYYNIANRRIAQKILELIKFLSAIEKQLTEKF